MHRNTREAPLLVVKLGDLGDVLLAEPAFRSLRTAFPSRPIDVLVQPNTLELIHLIAPSFRPVTISRTAGASGPTSMLLRARQLAKLAVKLRARRYDTIVLLQHITTDLGERSYRLLAATAAARHVVGLDNGRGSFLTAAVEDTGFGALHESEYYLAVAQLAGGAQVDPRPRMSSVHEPETAAPAGDYVIIYPATGPYSPARNWPIAAYSELALLLNQRGTQIVLVGAADAVALAAEIGTGLEHCRNLTGNTSLEQLICLVQGARAVVGGDSFIGHLASALGRPTVTIFGPSNADAWRPVGAARASGQRALPTATAIALDAGFPCSPCLYTGFTLGRPEGCPDRTCMRALSPRRVLDALDVVMATADE